eukprot:89334_1
MTRLYHQIVGKTKSFNDLLFSRFSFKPKSIFLVTTLKSKISTSKRAIHSLSLPLPSIQLPSIDIPFHKPSFHFNKPHSHKHQQEQRSKHRTRYKYGYAALTTYLCCEILFYLRCRYLEHYANNISVDIVRPTISHERCEHLFDLVLKYAGLYQGSYEGWLKLWFNGCDIDDLRSDNILELFHWGFFVENYVKHDDDIDDDELQWREEFVQNGLKKLETLMRHTFPIGHNAQITDRFNTKQSVKTDHHSFTLYLLVTMVQMWSNVYFSHHLGLTSEWIHGMKVWYKIRDANGYKDSGDIDACDTHNALLFLHGIGIGLGPYYNVVEELMKKSDHHMLCMIEMPHVTVDVLHLLPWPFSAYSYITKRLPPDISDYIEVLNVMERKLNGVNDVNWTFVGHSYGTMIASNMYLQMKDERKPRLLLLDPACFCLSHPSTVRAFITDFDEIVANDDFNPKW